MAIHLLCGTMWRVLWASVTLCHTHAFANTVQECALLCTLGDAIFATGSVAGGIPLPTPGKVEHFILCRSAISVSG